ncbi:MAG: ABC transporter substrate-binding protein [Nesterenkonia sp.]|nr:ABC transporter substrate-binding protein [Nesterenkonia sp.]
MALMTACGEGEDEGEGVGGDDELTEVTVGVMPIVDTAAIWLGVEEGIFEEHGLDVDLEVAQGGAAIAPAVVSGDYEFGFSNVVSLFVAADQGLPLTMLTPGVATTGDTSSDIGAVLTMPDSDIDEPADLEGHTVAVNTLNNIGDATVSHVVSEDGGDASEISFVEMNFPDMPAAVTSGQVDAAWVLEPFSTIAQEQGAEVVTYNFAETDPELLIASFFTDEQYAQEEPEVVDAFTDAMTESLEYAEENPDEARAILNTYTEIDDETLEEMVMPSFPAEFNTDAVQNLADLSLEHDLISDEIDASDLIR